MPEFRALEYEVARLKQQQAEGAPGSDPRTRLAELGAEVAELREQVAQLQGSLDETRHLAQRAMIEPGVQGASEGEGVAPSALTPTVDGSSPSGRSGAAAPVVASTGSSSGAAEVRDYEGAFTRYRRGEYPAAAADFQEFLDRYPGSEYADNALFWMGECHLKTGDYELAAVTFDRVVKQYPEGNKVPDALYRQGVTLLEIGERKGQSEAYDAAARELFGRILSDYPSSDRAGEARRQLERLGS